MTNTDGPRPTSIDSLVQQFKKQGITPDQVRRVIAGMPDHAIATLLADSGARG